MHNRGAMNIVAAVARVTRLALAASGLGWTAYHLWLSCDRALEMWQRSYRGPRFIYWHEMPEHLAATDWRTPLLVAALPLAAFGAWQLLAGWLRRRRPAA